MSREKLASLTSQAEQFIAKTDQCFQNATAIFATAHEQFEIQIPPFDQGQALSDVQSRLNKNNGLTDNDTLTRLYLSFAKLDYINRTCDYINQELQNKKSDGTEELQKKLRSIKLQIQHNKTSTAELSKLLISGAVGIALAIATTAIYAAIENPLDMENDLHVAGLVLIPMLSAIVGSLLTKFILSDYPIRFWTKVLQ